MNVFNVKLFDNLILFWHLTYWLQKNAFFILVEQII